MEAMTLELMKIFRCRHVLHACLANGQPWKHFGDDGHVPVEGTIYDSENHCEVIGAIRRNLRKMVISYDEIILFVDENNEIDDMTLYALGLKSEEEIKKLMDAVVDKKTIDYEVQKWTYEEICSRDFRTILSSDCYTYDEKTGTYTDLRNTDTGLKYLYDNALKLHVVGIAKPSENAIAASNRGFIGYTSKLTEYIIEKATSLML